MDNPDPYGTYIAALHYRVVIRKGCTYDSPRPVAFDGPDANYRLDDDRLVATPKRDYATADDAREAIEPALRAWEARADLQYDPGEFRLEFDHADPAFRSPPPPGTILPGSGALRIGQSSVVATATLTRHAYPDPPVKFAFTPDVQVMHFRYTGSLAGREPLLSMAYFCLTNIEAIAQGRDAAARLLAVDSKILKKLGDLSTNRGAELARKAQGKAALLTSAEEHWLREALRRVIVRVGEVAAGAPLAPLTMGELPAI
jgi:hypothetical protein